MKLQCGILALQHTFTDLMLSTCQIRKDNNCAINVTP